MIEATSIQSTSIAAPTSSDNSIEAISIKQLPIEAVEVL